MKIIKKLFQALSNTKFLKLACAINCKNGRCIISNGVEICECNSGFVGKNCDQSDPCLQKPCVNGACYPVVQPVQGTSLEQVFYFCQCYYGFYGKNCELSILF